ncbi:10490_t:CDS:2 [Entrophospora sp. SA101]|nr:10490_t:CDS:2 [Entrophospora sp. SA101]
MVTYPTISAYVLSTILTGIELLLFTVFKFFPRHIYIGTFGGIGCYLLKTAIKFSVRLSEKYYDLEGSKELFLHENNFLSWGLDFVFGFCLLINIRCKAKSNLVPTIITLSFLSISLGFNLVIHVLNTSQKSLIKDGWIFDFQKNQTTIPEFYSDFSNRRNHSNNGCPCILYDVDINISKLETSLDDHQLNTDHELIVQRVSNLIAGTFQVSLRYEESILLIKSGVNNRVVRLILAFCIDITVYFGELLFLIEYIPTTAVGTIIFYLGLDMIQEALLDSWKIFNKLEYLNIIATMGNSDRSSVRRHYRDHKFLEKLCSRIYGMTLQVGVQHQTISSLLIDEYFCSNHVEDAGKIVFKNKIGLESKNKLVNILMKAFKGITNEKEEFFNLLVPYFTKEEIQKDSQLWSKGDNPHCIYVVEQGELGTWIPAENNKKNVIERILPFTMVGELGFFTDNQRPTNLVTNTLCVLWKMDQASYLSMMKCNPVLGAIFMKLVIKLSVERLRSSNHYAFD